MEKLVFNKLNEVLATRNDICKCDQCRLDIAAIALNSLAPRYIVTEKGKIYAKIDMMETQFGVDILMAISKGLSIVAAKPRHTPKKEG
jgi:competence protein ComFB